MTDVIRLYFDPDNSAAAELLRAKPLSLAGPVVEHSYLRLPVGFVVGGVDILANPEISTTEAWLVNAAGAVTGSTAVASQTLGRRLPLLGFLATLETGLREIRETGLGSFLIPEGGRVRLARRDGEVEITPERGASLRAPLQELETAIGDYRTRLRRWIAQEVPELLRHPDLQWFTDQPENFGPSP